MGRQVPRWLWNTALGSLIGVIALAAILLGLALAGAGDLAPAGPLVVDDAPAQPPAATAGEGLLSLIETVYRVYPPATVEITARQTAGPGEAFYGLWWGVAPDDVTAAVVNGSGYFGVSAVQGVGVRSLLDRQRFPHVRRGGEANRIRVDWGDGQAVVRINDEWAAEVSLDGAGARPAAPLMVGWVMEAPPRGGAAVRIERIRIWQAASGSPPLPAPDAHGNDVAPRPVALIVLGLHPVIQPPAALPHQAGR
jgi:hypothetical protein